jgi:hypothetical protein
MLLDKMVSVVGQPRRLSALPYNFRAQLAMLRVLFILSASENPRD